MHIEPLPGTHEHFEMKKEPDLRLLRSNGNIDEVRFEILDRLTPRGHQKTEMPEVESTNQ